MQKGLVSIITPCYNTGNIVHRLLESILYQDYQYVEMYAIDDGSTDNTAEVILSYTAQFVNRGYELKYIKQENGGQSSALNNGLKLVKGEFLIWPDSDDYFKRSDALSTFVSELQKRDSNYGVIRCLPTYIDEDTLEEKYKLPINEYFQNESQFENCLYDTNFFWGAGNYMIKMEAFDKVNPKREIYVDKNAGQNWQILLPILYSYNCATIEESLFSILERSSSHCRISKSYIQKVLMYDSFQNSILKTLDNMHLMPIIEKDKYKKNIKIKYHRHQLELAIWNKDWNAAKKIKQELSKEDYIVNTQWVLRILLRSSYLLRGISKIQRWLKK